MEDRGGQGVFQYFQALREMSWHYSRLISFSSLAGGGQMTVDAFYPLQIYGDYTSAETADPGRHCVDGDLRHLAGVGRHRHAEFHLRQHHDDRILRRFARRLLSRLARRRIARHRRLLVRPSPTVCRQLLSDNLLP